MTQEKNLPGHWLLAKMGKKVLRPGGKEMTLEMLDTLNIGEEDLVVEFAPGIGWTAEKTLAKNPKSYIGIELDPNASKNLQEKFTSENQKIIQANARNTGLPENSATKLYGEAMLSMQVMKHKEEIISEAHRVLKKGGLYGIHELALKPNDIDETIKQNIKTDLMNAIKVNVAPLTIDEWSGLLQKGGFEIVKTFSNPMHLLEPKRVVSDEGFFRAIKFFFNVLTHKKARKRIFAMKKIFKKYEKNMCAVMIVAKKK